VSDGTFVSSIFLSSGWPASRGTLGTPWNGAFRVRNSMLSVLPASNS